MMLMTELLIRRDRDSARISVEGAIGAASADAFGRAVARDVPVMAADDNPIELDFDDLELIDGSAVAEAVNALRDMLRNTPLVVRRAPQMLAHTLYQAGLLRGGRLRLVAPRG